MKKIISVILSVLLILSLVPLSVISANAETYNGTCGDNVTWEFDSSTGTLTISGLGEMFDAHYPWKAYYHTLIKKVIIEDGVTSIGTYAFSSCADLQEVILGESIENIGYLAFADCNELTKIIIPDSVTSIGDQAFYECTGLEEVILGESIENIGHFAFALCDGLTKITIPKTVTNIGGNAFSGCTNLKTVINYSSLPIVRGSTSYGCVGEYAINLVNVAIKPSAPYLNSVTDNTVIISSYSEYWTSNEEYEFKINNGDWQDSEIFTGLTPNTTYKFYQRIKATADTPCSIESDALSVTTPAQSDLVLPISIEIKDTTVKEGYNIFAYYSLYEDYNEYQPFASEYTVTYSDGSQKSWSYPTQSKFEKLVYLESYETDQQSNPWVLGGTYSVTAKCRVCDEDDDNYEYSDYYLYDTFNVTVVETDIEKIEFGDITLIENSGYEEGVYDYYPDVTIYYKNGDIEHLENPDKGFMPDWYCYEIEGSGGSLEWGLWPVCQDTQDTTPWQLGSTYTVNASFLGFNGSFNVEIRENPIEEISVVSDIVYIEYLDSNFNDTYTCYDFGFSIKFKDGTYAETFEYPGCCYLWFNEQVYAFDFNEITLSKGENNGSFTLNVFGKEYNIKYSINLISRYVDAPTLQNKTDTTVTLTAKSGYEYRTENGKWQDSNVFTGLTPNISYSFYQRIKRTNTHYESATSEPLVVTTYKSTVAKPSAPTLADKTDTTVTLTAKSGYEYKKDNGEWQDSNVFGGLSPNTTYNFYQRIKETDTNYASESSVAFTVTTNKSAVTKPSAPTLSNKTDFTVTLVATDGYEYSKDGTIWQDSNVFSGLSPNTTYNFYQRVKETDTNYASESSEPLTVTTTRSLTEIKVTTKPNKLIYLEGESLDTSGMVVTAYYNDNTNKPVTDYQISGYTSTVGVKTITVSYNGKTASFNVTVNTRVPSSITSNTHKIEGSTISKINLGTTVKTLLSNLSAGEFCKVYKGTNEVSDTSKVGTGMVVKIMDGNTVKASYTVIVTGDTNGDGEISVTDMLSIKAHILNKTILTDAYATAADTSGDNSISITDFIQIKAKILDKGEIVAR